MQLSKVNLYARHSIHAAPVQILQALFAAFSTLFRRMVADHLGGTHEGITDDDILSVSKTNIVSERDFAQLDRLLQQKPLALEAMILSAINKTASWLKSKTETEIADLLRIARTPREERQKVIEAVLVSGLWQTEEQIIAGLVGLKPKTAKLEH